LLSCFNDINVGGDRQSQLFSHGRAAS
jgi:hypothetical protein